MEISNNLEQALKALGIQELNAMQEATLKATNGDEDLVLLSPTGSGKTIGFLLPLLKRLKKEEKDIQALVMVPSRELALQIEQVFRKMSTGFKVLSVYGGHSVHVELKSLVEPPAVLVGTPGRLKELLRRESLSFDHLQVLVFDEFDKSLEFGFWEDIEEILYDVPSDVYKILTSATKAVDIPDFVNLYKSQTLNFLSDTLPKGLTLHALKAEKNDKLDALLRLIGTFNNEQAIIFCNHRAAVDRIGEHLEENEIHFDSFHGGLAQDVRERSLLKFRNGSIQYLLTTDLAARGLDIPEIKHIVHYQLPQTEDAYIHRNGRTARMHAEGKAYLVCSEDEEMPKYVKQQLTWIDMPQAIILPDDPEWATLYFSGGKKHKINKIDIVGLLSKKGKLGRDEVGLIEVKDFSSYAAVKRDKVQKVMKLIRNEKVKKQKLKIEIAK
ncbi:DEAD/DEAH box helicase [Sediminitomix flava]|uniref:ATP-independent RNA helicase DbpA n=1 Tax=Sediminitomix flava TaxID=379075 RepID=A0A315ZCK6_SEDFL|nr:DEAD/DEAH box helicase [Sediminitomix flava]PWJ42474.1 ATP-independent RNA helicase DbpA [Sediminitomix flava]